MVVTNNHRITAIVIRHDGTEVTLVPMKSGKLSALHLSADAFRAEWHETDYALPRAMETFQHHADEWGASQEVRKGLARLQARDACVVAPLF